MSSEDQIDSLYDEIRSMRDTIEELQQEKREALQLADDFKMLCRAQQYHSELCASIYEAAVKAKIIYALGACGNGGIPTFEAIVHKCVEAINKVGQLNK